MKNTLLYIAEKLSEKFSVEISKAVKLVNSSFVAKAINDIPDYIHHYDAEYWADQIMEDADLNCI
ncbi:MAG: hypothetical protein NC299_18420 [Lachnospiraceae bacterium]|nr:hypothetical protein [Lachnospiraceae bacterium]